MTLRDIESVSTVSQVHARGGQAMRYSICIKCKTRWNIAIKQRIPMGGYLCPYCAARRRA